MKTSITTEKLIVIDTEGYTGSFVRQMCAYITGQIGECEVGKKEAQLAQEEMIHAKWWSDNIRQEEDEGCFRPTNIYPTPGWFNNGNGGHFKIGSKDDVGGNQYPAYQSVAIFVNKFPPEDVWKEFQERANEFVRFTSHKKYNINMTAFKQITKTVKTEIDETIEIFIPQSE